MKPERCLTAMRSKEIKMGIREARVRALLSRINSCPITTEREPVESVGRILLLRRLFKLWLKIVIVDCAVI